MIKKLVALLLFIPYVVLAQESNYYFFSKEDIESIRSSSQTEWGGAIMEKLKKTVDDRREHSLRVPLLEGGHGHDYFCPIHNQVFRFDWDKPHAHYCSLCDKYWEDNNKFDWAWINHVHLHNRLYLTACMYLYIVTGEVQYAEYIRDMMLDYASKYLTYLNHDTARRTGPWGGKMFGQSLDEAVWASDACRAYRIAKPVMTEEEIRKIETGYLTPCADLLLGRRGDANWQVWHNSGLIALGISLQNDSIIDIAVNDPECGYHVQMDRHVLDDGWWGEGSPVYHYYPLQAMLLSADAVRCRGINLYDDKLYKMLAAPASAVYADLFFPSHNDGWYGESLVAQAHLYEIAYTRYEDPFFLDVLSQCYRYTERNSVEALLNNSPIETAAALASWPSVHFKDAGFAVLRSGDRTAVLKYGPHGGGHGHPDKLSISFHDGEKEIISDMGTSAYGVPAFTGWYRKTLSHSTLTVDGKDQRETTGELVSFEVTRQGGEVKARVSDAYPGVEMERQLTLQKDKLIDLFTAISTEEHVYDHVLILTEEPVFDREGEAVILDDAPAYGYIANTTKRTMSGSVSCQVGNATLNVSLPGTVQFEVITGEAPGIPPGNERVNEKYPAHRCYPLIIRLKHKDLRIKTEWEF
ncbi:MAG: heparinase II/III family protein [Proteiniphilum sp.]